MPKISVACLLLTTVFSWQLFATSWAPLNCPAGEVAHLAEGQGDRHGPKCTKISSVIEGYVGSCKKGKWADCLTLCKERTALKYEEKIEFNCDQPLLKECQNRNPLACLFQSDMTGAYPHVAIFFQEIDFSYWKKLNSMQSEACSSGQISSCSRMEGRKEKILEIKSRCQETRMLKDCFAFYVAESLIGNFDLAQDFYQVTFGDREKGCLKGKSDDCLYLFGLLAIEGFKDLENKDRWNKACKNSRADHPRFKLFCEVSKNIQKENLKPEWQTQALVLPKGWQAKEGWPKLNKK